MPQNQWCKTLVMVRETETQHEYTYIYIYMIQQLSYWESERLQLASLPTRGMLLTLVYLSTLKLAPHMAPSLSTLGIAFILFIGCSKLINPPPPLWNIHPAHATIHVRTMLSFRMILWWFTLLYIYIHPIKVILFIVKKWQLYLKKCDNIM